MSIKVMLLFLIILIRSGCTSYDSCKDDCIMLHRVERDTVYTECIDIQRESLFSALNCNFNANVFVNNICYDACRGN